ncbi:cyclase family protein [Sulfodiicoccus acidiphilus]|nr:cyclase family protein [Sulfodiicoccus acidiphilus]
MILKAIHDLSAELKSYMPSWPTNPFLVVEPVALVPRDGYSMERLAGLSHTGTHVDSPAHFFEGGQSVDELDLTRLMGEGYCLRPPLRGREIGREELSGIWRPEYDGKIVLLYTGWSSKRSFTREFMYNFPGLTKDAAEFLVERGVRAVGIDTLSVDPYANEKFEAHKVLLSHGVPIIEDLSNLSELQEGKSYLVAALPIKLKGGSGAMARVVAVEVE